VICGVNEFVSGPDYSEDACLKKKKFNGICVPGVYYRTHANFLATQQVGSATSTPTLFFAELSNDDDDRDSQLLCCPVNLPLPRAGMLIFLLVSFFYRIHIVLHMGDRYRWPPFFFCNF
jgi:hypothetical protein